MLEISQKISRENVWNKSCILIETERSGKLSTTDCHSKHTKRETLRELGILPNTFKHNAKQYYCIAFKKVNLFDQTEHM
jgi:hypothetical protein